MSNPNETSWAKTAISAAFQARKSLPLTSFVSGRGYNDDEIIAYLRASQYRIEESFIRHFFNDLPAFTNAGWVEVISSWLCFALDFPSGHEAQYLIYDLRRRSADKQLLHSLNDSQINALMIFVDNLHVGDDDQLRQFLEEIRCNLTDDLGRRMPT